MRDLRLRRLWLGVGVVLVAGVIGLSLAPGITTAPPGGDKTAHLLAYAVCSLWFGWIYQGRALASVGVVLIVLGVIIELLQELVPGRGLDAGDILANGVGVLIGAGGSLGRLGDVLMHLERRLGLAAAG